MPYSIKEHKHRFAAWAASRAASVKGCRFSVEVGKTILDKSGLSSFLENPDELPEKQYIDEMHRAWREKIISIARDGGNDFTHGVSAKLINIYFKAVFVCGGYHFHPKVTSLHPPIDSVLIDGLKDNNVGNLYDRWNYYSKVRWSNFDCNTYENIISDIRLVIPDSEAIWTVEQYWRGFQ